MEGKKGPFDVNVNEAMDREQAIITESINGAHTIQILYIMRGPLVLEVYSHDVASFPVPAVSLTLYTS